MIIQLRTITGDCTLSTIQSQSTPSNKTTKFHFLRLLFVRTICSTKAGLPIGCQIAMHDGDMFKSICGRYKEQLANLTRITSSTNLSTQEVSWQEFGRSLHRELLENSPETTIKLGHAFHDLPNRSHRLNGVFHNSTEMARHWNFHFIMRNRYDNYHSFSFNIDGEEKQTQPNLDGGLEIKLKTADNMKDNCFEAKGCSCYLVMIHAPKTLPV